jgi:pimeloyl-ACP methyl ester carboxylesterase
MVQTEIRYTRSGGVAIAYQVVGDGDVDLVYVPDFMSNLVYAWLCPRWRDFYEQLASRFRLILFDKRGTGLSDHGGQFATLETRMEDLHAVLDAAASNRTVILASHEGCGMAAMYAATYPERTVALALFHPRARGPGLQDESTLDELVDLRERWGTQELSDQILLELCPTLYASDEERRWFADYLRIGASPAVAYALNRAFAEIDLREVLPSVRVPTLVMYRATEREVSLDVASRIPASQPLCVSGDDYLEIHLSPEIADEVARFVGGERVPDVPESVLSTIMFTDIVGSTERVAELGDTGWRDLPRVITRWCGASSPGSAGRSATRPVTASSRPSTDRLARSAVATPSSPPSARWVSTCGSGCTSGSARSTRASWPGWRSRPVPESPQPPAPARCWSPAPCAISWPVRGCCSPSAASAS